jgi:hypothetical protein
VVSAVPRVPRVRAGACARGWADSSLESTRRVRGIPGARVLNAFASARR